MVLKVRVYSMGQGIKTYLTIFYRRLKMSNVNWKDTIGTIAPSIATALLPQLGLAGVAIKAIGDVFGITEPDEDKVAKAVTNMSPEQMAAVKASNDAFKVKMANLGVDMEELASRERTRMSELDASDRASAREREIKLGDKTTSILAYIILCLFFLVLAGLFFLKVDPTLKDVLLICVGTLSALTSGVANYYFGSSHSSANKDSVIKGVVNRSIG